MIITLIINIIIATIIINKSTKINIKIIDIIIVIVLIYNYEVQSFR